MSLWNREKPPTYCDQCGCAFKPRGDTFTSLCLEHAQPHLAAEARMRRLVEWTRWHLDAVEELEKADNERLAAAGASNQGALNNYLRGGQASNALGTYWDLVGGQGNAGVLGGFAAQGQQQGQNQTPERTP